MSNNENMNNNNSKNEVSKIEEKPLEIMTESSSDRNEDTNEDDLFLKKLSEMTPEELQKAMLRLQGQKTEKSIDEIYIKKSKSPLWIILIIILAILVSIGSAYAIRTYQGKVSTSNDLANAKAIAGPLVVLNPKVVSYGGNSTKDADYKDQALASGGTITTPPGVIFGNTKTNTKNVLEFYIDFSSQKSRDMILYNQNMIKSFIESGLTKVIIHPILSGNFGNYAAESLMEVVSVNPDEAWNYLIESLKLSATWSDDPPDAKDMVDGLVKLAKDKSNVTLFADDINRGLFISWMLSIKSDSHLTGGFDLPLIYYNNQKVNVESVVQSEELKSIVTENSLNSN